VARARNPRWQARALWLLARGDEASRALVREQLSHESADLRLCALRALAAGGHDVLDLARRFAQDPAPAVRAQALALLAPLAWEDKRECLMRLLEPWPRGEAQFLDALTHAVGQDFEDFAAAAAEASSPIADAATRAEIVAALARRLGVR
jgi:hypothetical protein